MASVEDELKSEQAKKEQMGTELKAREASIESYNKQITLLQEEVQLLQEQVRPFSVLFFPSSSYGNFCLTATLMLLQSVTENVLVI